MANWRELYQSRLTTAEEAVKRIKSEDRVVLTHAVAEPAALVEAMVHNAEAYRHVTISSMVYLGKGDFAKPEYKDSFTYSAWFLSAPTRGCVNEGRGDFTPVFFHQVPGFIRKGYFPVDVCLAMVSPPDEHGYCSLGPSCDYSYQAVKSAKVVLAQVNDRVPVIYGDSFVHVSEFDCIVEESRPLPELPPGKLGDVEMAIGGHCAELVPDGATLQLGIGAIPDAVLQCLTHKKDLGIHSEMISDGVVDLCQAGVITNERKTLNPGKMIVTFLMGTKKLYDFAEKNPQLIMRPVDYVNNPCIIAQNNDMICINSALQVDLMGQIVSSTIGLRQFSGVGGQVDFMRGAAMSLDTNAKGIIAMPSSTVKKDGTRISKITPFIDQGAAVTTSRQDADYVVTEYGAAPLKGKTLRQRAKNLISIAHPEFREELKAEFERRFYESL